VFAGAASASTLTGGPGTITWTAAAAIDNDVTIDQASAGVNTVTIDTTDDPVTGGIPANCTDTTSPDFEVISCTGVTNVVANSLDGNDEIIGLGLDTVVATFDGGDGNDAVHGGEANDTLNGGAGDDFAEGDGTGAAAGVGGNDTIDGGPGFDFVAGGKGDDVVTAGADNDDGAVGGPGNDTVSGGSGNDGFLAGGPGVDTVNGEDGNDDLYGGCDTNCGPNPADASNDTLNGGNGFDELYGEGGNDTLNGGADGDYVEAGAGDDAVNGGDGDDEMYGDDGVDTMHGDAGDDYVEGDAGNDILHGDAGDDTVQGSDGDDQEFGEAGNDQFGGFFFFASGDLGNDTFDGGTGIDTINYRDAVYDPITGLWSAVAVRVTIDNVANDGQSTENDNVKVGVEDVNVSSASNNSGPPLFTNTTVAGGANLLGDASVNVLDSGEGNDTVDGGANNDFLYGRGGNDTMNARDGFADRVICGEGTDVANVDEFDQLADDCETINRVPVGSALEDKPPTVAWTAPASAAKLSTKTANLLSVNATDDKGISQVIFLDDESVVCTDTTAPYTCDYKPKGGDVGKNTLVAMAVDTSQQTASAIRSVTVPRFAVKKLTSKTKPKSDTSDPRTFTTSGKLTRPTGVTAGQGCKGKVTVTFKAGKATISTRTVKLKKNCTYTSKVTFEVPSRLAGKLQVVVRYGGNAVLAPKSAKRGKVTT
jgi:Ca2+-binding RTX toxin-like protein